MKKQDAFLVLQNLTKARQSEDNTFIGVFYLPLKGEELIEKINYEEGDEVVLLQDELQELPKCIYKGKNFKEINRLYELANELPNFMYNSLDELVEIFGSVDDVVGKSGTIHLIEGFGTHSIAFNFVKRKVFANDINFFMKSIDEKKIVEQLKEEYHFIENDYGIVVVEK